MRVKGRPCEEGQLCAWKQGRVCGGFPIRVSLGPNGGEVPAYKEVGDVSLSDCATVFVPPRSVPISEPPPEHREFFNHYVSPMAAENTRRIAQRKKVKPAPEPVAEGQVLF